MIEAPSAGRAAWILTRLRVLRLYNSVSYVWDRSLSVSKRRSATPGKKKNRWLTSFFIVAMMMFSFGNLAHQGLINLHRALDLGQSVSQGPGGTTVASLASRAREQHYYSPSAPFSEALNKGLALELVLLMLAGLTVAVGSKELAQPDWDLEWLTTLPFQTSTLLWSRVVERSVVNPASFMILVPTCVICAFYGGHGWALLATSLFAALCLLFLTGLLRTIVDTGLRLSLSPPKLRGLQALISLTGLVPLYLGMSIAVSPDTFVLGWIKASPEWILWTPVGLVARALGTPDRTQVVGALAMLFAQTGLLLLAGVKVLEWQLRFGIESSGVRETGRAAGQAVVASKSLLRSPVHRRELTLLSRDRNFLVQTILLPVIVVTSQILLNGKVTSVTDLVGKPETMAAIAFGISAYALMFSAFQTLNSEGGALWLLYTVPRPLEEILREKARLWAVLALIYPLAIFSLGFHFGRELDAQTLSLAFLAVVGVPIYSVIATALGVFGCDPLAQDVQTRLRPTYVYLYLTLCAIYTYAIYASEWWQRLVFIVLSTCLALALWQKARDELPYLLDPAASPPARVSLSDGLIAAMLFAVLQGISLVVMVLVDNDVTATKMVIAFVVAGSITYGVIRYHYWQAKTEGVPATFKGATGSVIVWGVGAGAAAAIVGVLYIAVLPHLGPVFEEAKENPYGPLNGPWLLALAVLAAPLFEEFIFRGLIFSGLRRSLPLVPAILANAGLFAIVHPPVSMLPVFVLGIAAAVAYERTRVLIAPMIAHGVYNAVVLGIQMSAS